VTSTNALKLFMAIQTIRLWFKSRPFDCIFHLQPVEL
jgi:hypothetical protein